MADDSGGSASGAGEASHQDGASRFAELGGRVHYLDYPAGSAAPAFLCLHGLGGSAVNFRAVAPRLRSRARVVAPDLLGHGRTYAGRAGDGGAVEANLDLIARFVDEVVGAPVVLVGHSLGGILALLHTMRVPSDVQGLVLLDPPVPGRSRWPRDWRLTARLAFLRAPGVGGLVARQLERLTPEALVARQLADATPHVDRIPAEVVDASVAEVVARRAGEDARAAQDLQWAAILETIALLARPRAWRGWARYGRRSCGSSGRTTPRRRTTTSWSWRRHDRTGCSRPGPASATSRISRIRAGRPTGCWRGPRGGDSADRVSAVAPLRGSPAEGF
jgi:pimeloyl-ACP methyl ester carboxylesterase